MQEADTQLTASPKDSRKKAQTSPDLEQQSATSTAPIDPAVTVTVTAKQNGAALPSPSAKDSSENGTGKHSPRPKR